MIRIAVLGDIGSGKSHVAKQFGYLYSIRIPSLIIIFKKNVKIQY